MRGISTLESVSNIVISKLSHNFFFYTPQGGTELSDRFYGVRY